MLQKRRIWFLACALALLLVLLGIWALTRNQGQQEITSNAQWVSLRQGGEHHEEDSAHSSARQ